MQKDFNKFFKDMNDVIKTNPKSTYTKRKYTKTGKYSKCAPVRTLRDDFALVALPALIQKTVSTGFPISGAPIAQQAYIIAAAMLAERNKGIK